MYRDDSVYVATRNEIFRLRDSKNRGAADVRTPLSILETKGAYPHNGLSGIAFDFHGDVYFGMGENLGFAYTLVGSDGVRISGGGEGGTFFAAGPTAAISSGSRRGSGIRFRFASTRLAG